MVRRGVGNKNKMNDYDDLRQASHQLAHSAAALCARALCPLCSQGLTSAAFILHN